MGRIIFDKQRCRRPGVGVCKAPAWLAVLGASLVLCLETACSLHSAYERPAAPVPADYPHGPAYKAGSQTRSRDGEPAAGIGWREVIKDARLQALIDLALANNRDLRQAALRVQQLQAQYRIQRATQFPTVDAAASATRSRTPGYFFFNGQPQLQQSYSVALQVSWTLDFFGRIESLKEQALQQYFASAYARQALEILLVSQVADQYLVLLTDQELLDVTSDALKTAQESFQLTQARYAAGTTDELAMRQAEGVLEQARANYTAYVRAHAQDENALALLVGHALPVDLPPATGLTQQQLLADIPAGLPSDLLSRRPDILQAEANLRASNASLGAARAAFFPEISLTGSLGTASDALSSLFRSGSQAWAFTPQLRIPVYNAGALAASLDVALLQKDMNIAAYEKAIQSAFREVADGLAARGTWDSQVDSLARSAQSQQRQLELARTRYLSGVDSYLNVLNAQNGWYAARQALSIARLYRAANLVNLYRALGGGWLANSGEMPRPPDVSPPPEWRHGFHEGKKD